MDKYATTQRLGLVINDIEGQMRCMNCSLYLIKHAFFFDDSSKVNVRSLEKWFAFVLALAADFGIETFILYPHDHLDSEALSDKELDKRSKRDILLTLISYIVGKRFNFLLDFYTKESGKTGIKSVRSFLEIVLVFCGLQPESLLAFFEILNREDFQSGTREASHTDMVAFINFFTILNSDLMNDNNQLDDRKNLETEFRLLVASNVYNFEAIENFYRKYYSSILPSTGEESKSRRFINHLEHFENLFHNAIQLSFLHTRRIGDFKVSSYYCIEVLKRYSNSLNELENILKEDVKDKIDELSYLTQVVECDLSKLNFKKRQANELNQHLENTQLKVLSNLKDFIESASKTDLQCTPQSLDQLITSSIRNIPDFLNASQPAQPLIDQRFPNIGNVPEDQQIGPQLEQPGLQGYLGSLNLEQNALDQLRSSNMPQNIESAILSSVQNTNQPSTSSCLDELTTTFYDPYELPANLQSKMLNVVNNFSSQQLFQIPFPLQLSNNLRSNFVSALTNQPNKLGFVEQNVQQPTQQPIQLETDEILRPYEESEQAFTFESDPAEQAQLFQYIQQSNQLLREQEQLKQDLLQSQNQLSHVHNQHHVQSIESDQPSTSYSQNQPINLVVEPMQSSTHQTGHESIQIQATQPLQSIEESNQLESMQPSTSYQVDQQSSPVQSEQPSTSFQTGYETIQIQITQKAPYALSVPPMPKLVRINPDQSIDLTQKSKPSTKK